MSIALRTVSVILQHSHKYLYAYYILDFVLDAADRKEKRIKWVWFQGENDLVGKMNQTCREK